MRGVKPELESAVLQEDGRVLLNNHLRFTILYHRDTETDLARIVGFEVDPALLPTY